MIKFKDDELEIALVTYNRPACIKEWINNCLESIKNRNIRFSIYDSSSNNDTQKIVEKENELNENYINYVRIDSKVNIGYKAVIPMMTSQCRYVWICADRRYHDFDELDLYIFPKIKEEKYAYIQLGLEWLNDPYGKEYEDKAEWFYENFTGMSCYGQLIYCTDMFEYLKSDSKLMEYCEQKFKNGNYGTAFLGYFLTAFAMKDYRAYTHCVEVYWISEQTTTSWHDKYYTCAIGDMAELLNDISDVYTSKYKAMKKALKTVNAFSDRMLYNGRMTGDLCEVYDQYKDNGYWKLFTDEMAKIEFYAKASLDEVKRHYFLELGEECTDEELVLEVNKVVDDLRNIGNKKIFVYGAGYGGKLVHCTLKATNIEISGYIDKDWKRIQSTNGLDVVWLDSLNVQNCIIIVSVKKYLKQLEEECSKFGFVDEINLIYLVKQIIKQK